MFTSIKTMLINMSCIRIYCSSPQIVHNEEWWNWSFSVSPCDAASRNRFSESVKESHMLYCFYRAHVHYVHQTCIVVWTSSVTQGSHQTRNGQIGRLSFVYFFLPLLHWYNRINLFLTTFHLFRYHCKQLRIVLGMLWLRPESRKIISLGSNSRILAMLKHL